MQERKFIFIVHHAHTRTMMANEDDKIMVQRKKIMLGPYLELVREMYHLNKANPLGEKYRITLNLISDDHIV